MSQSYILCKRDNAWGFAPNPTKNLRFLDFPLRYRFAIAAVKWVPDAIIIASGSELSLAVEAKKVLAEDGIDVRVVSMPCMDIFEEQSEEYKAKVLPKNVRKRVAVEALSGFGWDRYVGLDGDMIGMNRFGASAPYSKLFPYFGFTIENVVARVKAL